MIGSRSGRPIVPFAVATSRYRAVNSWDRMTINLPFSKLSIVMGDAIYVPGHDASHPTIYGEIVLLAFDHRCRCGALRSPLLAQNGTCQFIR